MILTEITETKRKRYSLFFDGEFLFSVDGETVLRYGLKKGMEVDCGFLNELQSVCLVRKAQDRAMMLLSRRPYGEREMLRKLAEDYPPAVCEQMLVKLKDSGLIDDRAFAEQLVFEYREYRNYSVRRIRQELFHRGFDRDLIDSLLEEVTDDVSMVRTLLEEKYSRKLSVEGGTEKVKATLCRQGFSYDVIRQALREYLIKED